MRIVFQDIIIKKNIKKIKKNVPVLLPLLLIMLLSVLPCTGYSVTQDKDVNLTEARESGALTIGQAESSLSRRNDKKLNKNVWYLSYSISGDAMGGFWLKRFPLEPDPQKADIIRIGALSSDDRPYGSVNIVLELKGSSGVYKVPVLQKKEWEFQETDIKWPQIGTLREIVVVVSSAQQQITRGSLSFFITLKKQSFIQKMNSSILFKYLALFLLSIMLPFFYSKLFYKERKDEPQVRSLSEKSIWKDLIYGISFTGILTAVFHIYLIGKSGSLSAGWGFLIPPFISLILLGLLKYGITGKILKPMEMGQNLFLTGIMASASGSTVIFHPPSGPGELLMISNAAAASCFFIYHLANLYTFRVSGRCVQFITGAIITGIPFLFGWLFVLESKNFLNSIGTILTMGLLDPKAQAIDLAARIFVVFTFTEILVSCISLLTRRKLLTGYKPHLFIGLVSALVVFAPMIADLGSGSFIISIPAFLRILLALSTAILSLSGLWAIIYLITGIIIDSLHSAHPTWKSIKTHTMTGIKKGGIYSGCFMGIVYGFSIMQGSPIFAYLSDCCPLFLAAAAGALIFPLVKTIIESFDGSLAFFRRMRYSYIDPVLYARGALIGIGLFYGLSHNITLLPTSERVLFGLVIGILSFPGINLLRDIIYSLQGRGKVQVWKSYFIDTLLGGFIGSALAFYFDSSQVIVIAEKLKLYTGAGLTPSDFGVYPLISKWGFINLGQTTGGVRLFFNEALAGVINWSIAAWLFAINRTFLTALFQRDITPVKEFFSRKGAINLGEQLIQVLRWGLWMSPIISTFLRMMGEATWYNQDGAIRTLAAIYNNITLGSADFQQWSLNFFIGILSYDLLRVLIWLDHMGLRVATLVNLSFLGMDKLDEKSAKFIGRSAAARYIPECVKRFFTWAPLIIPFYIPRGKSWDFAWSESLRIQQAGSGGMFESLTFPVILAGIAGVFILSSLISMLIRFIARRRRKPNRTGTFVLSNGLYQVTLEPNGGIFSTLLSKGHDITRRSYERFDPAGRILFIKDSSPINKGDVTVWPVIGNFPSSRFNSSKIEQKEDSLLIKNITHEIEAGIEITLPDRNEASELWEVTVKNLSGYKREIKVVPFLEWTLNASHDDRSHTQYNRLFPQIEYNSDINSVIAFHCHTKTRGILASDRVPEGFITSRIDFIGRAQSVWSPRILETMQFKEPENSPPCPSFDPAGALCVGVILQPGASEKIRFLIGAGETNAQLQDMVNRALRPKKGKKRTGSGKNKNGLLIGHGEILPGAPKNYFTWSQKGNSLNIHTPFTPRPFDHSMSNSMGYCLSVTNRGLHTSSYKNAQQNRITPDWSDTVSRQLPGEALFLYDQDDKKWFSPTYEPLRDKNAQYETEFSVDGTARFSMSSKTLSTDLFTFVPPDDPVGIYFLEISNRMNRPRNIRFASYFQIVLSDLPEHSGPLLVKEDRGSGSLFFRNPRNSFSNGIAFASIMEKPDLIEKSRIGFLGDAGDISRPYFVENGKPYKGQEKDNTCAAGFLKTIRIPAYGKISAAVMLGGAGTEKEAKKIIQKYNSISSARSALERTKKWWLGLMDTVSLTTNMPQFDGYLNWLKYQALAERVWARRGFYQSSGAFGFRDQLQDTVNMIWVDPRLARKQILLHAGQQFPEGDVFHWFFQLDDGRTGFGSRSHASDNLLWLGWGVSEYIKMTGDESILDEEVSYLKAENPLEPLPKEKHGMGFLPFRSTRSDTIFNHCIQAFRLVLNKRMGSHGLPLIGTGDWNDGLDEIGSRGKGESVWLGFFFYYILDQFLEIIRRRQGPEKESYYRNKKEELKKAIENTWREDRYLRAIHDDGAEIGIKGTGVWEIDALTASWAVMSGINPERGKIVFDTAIEVLEKENVIMLGWPALREDTKPFLGRSSFYPAGVRENGMYCHGVQWLVKAARILAEWFDKKNDRKNADKYRETCLRLWLKISSLPHTGSKEIELYGGQPNKQAADMLTTYDIGRMIWNGYTGAAGWMLRQAFEGVAGAALEKNRVVLPKDIRLPRGKLKVKQLKRDLKRSPLERYQ